jgi:hypothetical protein
MMAGNSLPSDWLSCPTISEAKMAMARAFDIAWDRFIQFEGISAATDDNRRRLAAQIVELAKSGVSNEDVLGEAGLIYLRMRAEAARLGGRRHGGDVASALARPADRGTRIHAPKTVAAMSAALELCLAALPLRIPMNAATALSIADGASHGRRDSERLGLHAVELLRAACMPEPSRENI